MKAFITGASKGMGNAISEKFASQGFDLILTARNAQELSTFASDLQSKYDINVHSYVLDMSNRSALKSFIETLLLTHADIEVLVNNVGSYISSGVLEDKEDTLDRMLGINLYPAYFLSRALAPGMADKGKGHIFNICSVAGIQPVVTAASYSISKFALIGLTKSLRIELLKKGVKVTAIVPGSTLTHSWEGTEVPPERFILPEDIAESIWTAYALSKGATVEEIIIQPQEGII